MSTNKPRVVILIQARMGATRLPGKPLKTIMGRPMISYLVERLWRVSKANEVVLATTTNPQDIQLVAYSQKEKLPFYRGSEEDVLDRFLQAARQHHADVIVRITADCPLMDPALVDQAIEHFLKGDFDYISTRLDEQCRFPRGMDVEVFSMKTFEAVAEEAKLPEEREHVTLYYYRHPEKFKLGSVVNQKLDLSKYRLTVDTPEDFELIGTLLEYLYPRKKAFDLGDIAAALLQHPEWAEINAHIRQKAI